MSLKGKRAVAVGLEGPGLPALAKALDALGYGLIARAADGASGLRLLQSKPCDLALVGAAMPGMDGLAFIERAHRLRLTVTPDMLLLLPSGMRLPGAERLSGLGAEIVCLPMEDGALQRALNRLNERRQSLPPELASRLETLLDELGVPDHPGRACLARAVAIVWRDRRRLRGIYAQLAATADLTPAQVRRAISHAIEVAWGAGEIERQHRIFGDTIDARRGKPTCGEMIAQLAEELRWEGPQ